MLAATKVAEAFPFIIGPKRQTVLAAGESKEGRGVQPDHHFVGMRSTMSNFLFIPGGSHIETLPKQGRVVHRVREAFGHFKTLASHARLSIWSRRLVRWRGGNFLRLVALWWIRGFVTVRTPKLESFKGAINMVRGAKDSVDVDTYNISQHENLDREMGGLSSMVAC